VEEECQCHCQAEIVVELDDSEHILDVVELMNVVAGNVVLEALVVACSTAELAKYITVEERNTAIHNIILNTLYNVQHTNLYRHKRESCLGLHILISNVKGSVC